MITLNLFMLNKDNTRLFKPHHIGLPHPCSWPLTTPIRPDGTQQHILGKSGMISMSIRFPSRGIRMNICEI